MRPDTLILSATATVLDTTARLLQTVATVASKLASGLEPDTASAPTARATPPGPVRSAQRVTTPRRSTPDLAQLVKRPATDVIAAITDLSDTELGELYEREANGKRRTSVLQAIEAASAPPAQPEESVPPAAEADVREADVLVHTSETPA